MKEFFLFVLRIGQSPIAKVRRRSGNVFNVFNKTLVKLDKLNAQIEKHKADHLEQIASLQRDHDHMGAQLEKNNRLKDKLADFVA